MSGQNYFLITALPPLGKLPSGPPMSGQDLLEHVRENRSACGLVEAVFVSDDLLQRQGWLAGEIKDVSPIVLTSAQMRDEQPLPGYLGGQAERAESGRLVADAVWEAYYRHAARVAKDQRSGFLAEWVRHEVSLRNALAAARAKALELEEHAYLVAADLGGESDFAALLNEWSAAPNPLAGLKVLDTARWDWLGLHERFFSFANDELAAYAAKLILLHRWNRISAEANESLRTFPQPSSSTDERILQ